MRVCIGFVGLCFFLSFSLSASRDNDFIEVKIFFSSIKLNIKFK